MATRQEVREASKPDRVELFADGGLAVPQATAFSSIGRTLLYRLMETGDLPYTKIGSRRVIPKRALQELMAAGVK